MDMKKNLITMLEKMSQLNDETQDNLAILESILTTINFKLDEISGKFKQLDREYNKHRQEKEIGRAHV